MPLTRIRVREPASRRALLWAKSTSAELQDQQALVQVGGALLRQSPSHHQEQDFPLAGFKHHLGQQALRAVGEFGAEDKAFALVLHQDLVIAALGHIQGARAVEVQLLAGFAPHHDDRARPQVGDEVGVGAAPGREVGHHRHVERVSAAFTRSQGEGQGLVHLDLAGHGFIGRVVQEINAGVALLTGLHHHFAGNHRMVFVQRLAAQKGRLHGAGPARPQPQAQRLGAALAVLVDGSAVVPLRRGETGVAVQAAARQLAQVGAAGEGRQVDQRRASGQAFVQAASSSLQEGCVGLGAPQ